MASTPPKGVRVTLSPVEHTKVPVIFANAFAFSRTGGNVQINFYLADLREIALRIGEARDQRKHEAAVDADVVAKIVLPEDHFYRGYKNAEGIIKDIVRAMEGEEGRQDV